MIAEERGMDWNRFVFFHGLREKEMEGEIKRRGFGFADCFAGDLIDRDFDLLCFFALFFLVKLHRIQTRERNEIW